jgi:hypothetical protein
MTAKELLLCIDAQNMHASACGGHCLTAEEIRNMAQRHGLHEIAARIDVDGSPHAAECEVKKEAAK